jgi:hypothetical protein
MYNVDTMAKAKVTKLAETALAVLQATPDRQLKIVVLNKALFYLDLVALRDLGETVTGQEYVALPQGPVVDNYRTVLVGALTEAGLAEQLHVQSWPDGHLAKPIRARKTLDVFEHLSASELRVAEKVGASFNAFGSVAVSDLSHHNPGWIIARKNHMDGQPAPRINMLIALQQLHEDDDEDDAWLTAPLDAETRAICDRAHLATKPWE